LIFVLKYSSSSHSTDSKIEDKINIIEKISTTDSPLSRAMHRFYHNYDQEQINEMIKIIFITILSLIGLILFSSILFGIAICIRLISFSPIETVGTWNILPEESKV
jgi:lipopolysaccharide/colanic/teichoic acid biosynthesis glycosyltransferase